MASHATHLANLLRSITPAIMNQATEVKAAPTAVSVDSQIFLLDQIAEAYQQQLNQLTENGLPDMQVDNIAKATVERLIHSDSFHSNLAHALRRVLLENARPGEEERNGSTVAGQYRNTYASYLWSIIGDTIRSQVDAYFREHIRVMVSEYLHNNDTLRRYAQDAVRQFAEGSTTVGALNLQMENYIHRQIRIRVTDEVSKLNPPADQPDQPEELQF